MSGQATVIASGAPTHTLPRNLALDPATIVSLLVLGACVGFLAGLLGIGGGMIIVPFMAIVLERSGFPTGPTLKIAIGTSLATVMFTALSSVRAHHARGAVRWDVVRTLAPGIVIGSLASAQIVRALDSRLIAAIFAAFIAWSAAGMLRTRSAVRQDGTPRGLPGTKGMFVAGALIGVASAFLGAGGGFLTVPFLARRGLTMAQTVACSAACGLPIAAGGSIGYAIAGRDLGLPGAMIGFIWLPGLVAVAAASVLTAPYGARAAQALPVATMKRIFALLLFCLAGYMAWRATH